MAKNSGLSPVCYTKKAKTEVESPKSVNLEMVRRFGRRLVAQKYSVLSGPSHRFGDGGAGDACEQDRKHCQQSK